MLLEFPAEILSISDYWALLDSKGVVTCQVTVMRHNQIPCLSNQQHVIPPEKYSILNISEDAQRAFKSQNNEIATKWQTLSLG